MSDYSSDDEAQYSGTRVPERTRNAVLHFGASSSLLEQLIVDWRKALFPVTPYSFTAAYKKQDKIKLSELKTGLGEGHVSHVHLFHLNQSGMTLRIARMPCGPTLLFRVESFERMRDVMGAQTRSYGADQRLYRHPPLVILNKFPYEHRSAAPPAEKAAFLAGEMFRSLFPANVVEGASKDRKMKRVLLFSRVQTDSGEVLIDTRHYAIIGKSATKKQRAMDLLQKGKVPRLLMHKLQQSGGSYDDFIKGIDDRDCGFTTDTDGEGEVIQLPEDTSFGGYRNECRIKLVEIGPRLSLRLLSIEEGVCSGKVICNLL